MYQIGYTPLALQQLTNVASDDDRNAIVRRVAELAINPYHTRAPEYERALYRRAKAAGGRYRILFRIAEDNATVKIEFIGMRIPGNEQDAYAAFRRLLTESGL